MTGRESYLLYKNPGSRRHSRHSLRGLPRLERDEREGNFFLRGVLEWHTGRRRRRRRVLSNKKITANDVGNDGVGMRHRPPASPAS